MATAAIVGMARLATFQGDAYLHPIHWKSLSQWWEPFKSVRLVAQAFTPSRAPDHWIKVPSWVEARSLVDAGLPSSWEKRRLIKRVSREILKDAELVYLQMPSYETMWVFDVAHRLGIPVLVEFHGNWETSIVAQSMGTWLKRSTRRLRAYLVRAKCRSVAKCSVAVSTIGPELASQYVPQNKPLLITTNHTVEEKDFYQRRDFALHDPPRVLFVGFLERRKGVHVLLAALAQLRSTGVPFKLVVVGDGAEREKLFQQAQELSIREQVEFVGSVPLGPELLEFYRTADLFVLPSIAGEGVPRVLQEAMASGCPVIATDIGSTRWQLRDSSGYLVRPNDVRALGSAIAELLESETRRQQVAEQGLQIALEHTYERQRQAIANFVRAHAPPHLLKRCDTC